MNELLAEKKAEVKRPIARPRPVVSAQGIRRSVVGDDAAKKPSEAAAVGNKNNNRQVNEKKPALL